MKKDEVKIGGFYEAKVSDRLVTVRIDGTNSHGGWNATNTATGKRIRIKSAQRLRGEAAARGRKAEATEVETPEIETGADHDEKAKETVEAATKKPRSKKADGEQKEKRVSALDAAATILQKAGQPMRAQELIAAMAEQGLWSSPNGKTPHATLYAAIAREIATKGQDARFRKTDRGQFAFNKEGVA